MVTTRTTPMLLPLLLLSLLSVVARSEWHRHQEPGTGAGTHFRSCCSSVVTQASADLCAEVSSATAQAQRTVAS